MHPPTTDQQARFVTNLQRLLTEGEFVNTYKFALLLSLTRWAVEHPDHDERTPIDASELAPHFAELYWPHVRPFATANHNADMVAESRPTFGTGADEWSQMLVQDRGQRTPLQAPRVLKKIRSAQASGARLHSLPRVARETLLNEVRRSIAEMPLTRLHKVRDSSEPMRFLYIPGPGRYELRFEQGMVACLAHYALLVEEIVRSAWIRFVLRCNPRLLGAPAMVEDFLFPESRASLATLRAPLAKVQGNACFYCTRKIHGTPDVDHFLPWSRYRRDLGHNFVLAHSACNQAKSDHLASYEHLQRWHARNEAHGDSMAVQFDAAQVPHDWPTLKRVAGSLYELAAGNTAMVWHSAGALVPLDSQWRQLLGTG
ncbi:MAG: HNH endonuclease [Planctomycetes bacterium]|nr:HNH endonuclease [Planctomycetota bacterium]